MINRTKIENSIYDILDKDQKEIQAYIENEAQKTEEQKATEKEARNKQSNISDVNLAENIKNQESNPYNQLIVHTGQDNLTHNYFHHFTMYWDAGDVLSNVILKLPKTQAENTKYWITYTGEVDIYLGADIERETKQKTDVNNQAVSNEVYWSLQGMKPIFRGEIGRIKEYQEVLKIHIDSIGKRFKQKIPDEFRQSFINNQNVRDAFQAICEFLGVKYICPPPTTPPQDEEEETDSATTDGTENNVDNKTQQESSLAAAASRAINKAKAKADKMAANSASKTNKTDNSEEDETNTETGLDTNNEETFQNGYADVSFDANGSIVHGSVVIETSPDMEDTLLALTEHPLDKYLEDTTYVAVDVKKFLNGELFETIHGNYLDYGAITIEPKSAASSEMSNVSGGMPGDNTGENGQQNSNGGGNSSTFGNTSSRAREKNGWINGQLYQNGKIVLFKEYINSLSPQQASQKYIHGKYTYTSDTLTKLYRRSFGSKVT